MSCFVTDKFIFCVHLAYFWRAHCCSFSCTFRCFACNKSAFCLHELILLWVWWLILRRILQIYSIIVRFYVITLFGWNFGLIDSMKSLIMTHNLWVISDESLLMNHAIVAEIIWEHFQDWVQNLKNVRIYYFRATLKYHKISHNCQSKKSYRCIP